MADLPTQMIRLTELNARQAHPVSLNIGSGALAPMAEVLSVREIRKLRLDGLLSPAGDADWQFTADLGATVIQTCGVTLGPVTTRIDVKFTRLYSAAFEDTDAAGEVEMSPETDVEPLPAALDLVEIALEEVSLALPAFPRAEGVEPGDIAVTEPGKAPMTDEDARPFAGLAALRDKLDDPGNE